MHTQILVLSIDTWEMPCLVDDNSLTGVLLAIYGPINMLYNSQHVKINGIEEKWALPFHIDRNTLTQIHWLVVRTRRKKKLSKWQRDREMCFAGKKKENIQNGRYGHANAEPTNNVSKQMLNKAQTHAHRVNRLRDK